MELAVIPRDAEEILSIPFGMRHTEYSRLHIYDEESFQSLSGCVEFKKHYLQALRSYLSIPFGMRLTHLFMKVGGFIK
ncbi:MAG: hypothetical protein ASUL_09369 [Candidatus Aramenus sulfurataquae]|uniref:Uncharacterized protein n=1 Tax=Candidatus Aramenus sulfurataquae TaxID=1326980 RepID=W7KV42_9CREN|nr:MAG: hypothetical protein ASUL_09369 [Candidatus Aramenus sulfurataquae]